MCAVYCRFDPAFLIQILPETKDYCRASDAPRLVIGLLLRHSRSAPNANSESAPDRADRSICSSRYAEQATDR